MSRRTASPAHDLPRTIWNRNSPSRAAALINAHLTRRPQSIRALRPELPSLLSSMIMRLLEKAPERRYQSAAGLHEDLLALRDALAQGDSVEGFELARHDVPSTLQLPHRVYGRASETARRTLRSTPASSSSPLRVRIVHFAERDDRGRLVAGGGESPDATSTNARRREGISALMAPRRRIETAHRMIRPPERRAGSRA